MGATALRTTGIRKRYRLGQHGGAFRYGALRDTIYERFKHPFGRPDAPPPHIWALDGVDLEVKQGEVLGLVGRNGAGKSTLLKILSRITRPTEGRAQLFGRVGSVADAGPRSH